jgi:hypothetical protein
MQMSATAGTTRSLRRSTVSSRVRVPSAISATADSTEKRSRSRPTCARLRAAMKDSAVTVAVTITR